MSRRRGGWLPESYSDQHSSSSPSPSFNRGGGHGGRGAYTQHAPPPATSDFPSLPGSSKACLFPSRPGFGTVGMKCVVKANHFLVQVADTDLYQYDVSQHIYIYNIVFYILFEMYYFASVLFCFVYTMDLNILMDIVNSRVLI